MLRKNGLKYLQDVSMQFFFAENIQEEMKVALSLARSHLADLQAHVLSKSTGYVCDLFAAITY